MDRWFAPIMDLVGASIVALQIKPPLEMLTSQIRVPGGRDPATCEKELNGVLALLFGLV